MSQIDKRAFPNTAEKRFLQERNCNDRIYAYLLLQSKFNPNGRETHRYVEKMSNIEIAEALNISRNTVGTRMKDLKNNIVWTKQNEGNPKWMKESKLVLLSYL